MRSVTTVTATRSLLRRAGKPVVLVATMGALHHGHAELIRNARKIATKNGTVVVSIFVNPLQFGPNEDLAAYPRPRNPDRALCKSLGVDVVFQPNGDDIITPGASVFVDEDGSLFATLCGKSRPGHFRGVCTIVAKLFNIVQPQIAVFGEKDWQQLAIIRRMTHDLNFPVEIVGHPTVRDEDGLAVSSRNSYLSSEERAAAPRFREALVTAAKKAPSVAAIRKEAVRRLEKIPDTRIDYVEVVDESSLHPTLRAETGTILAAAIYLGRTRLIDNLRLTEKAK